MHHRKFIGGIIILLGWLGILTVTGVVSYIAVWLYFERDCLIPAIICAYLSFVLCSMGIGWMVVVVKKYIETPTE
jgi:hypothetical protein